MSEKPIPKLAFVSAILLAGLMFGAASIVVISSVAAKSNAIALAIAVCSCSAALFAFNWPSLSWKWGIWLSTGYWFYFGFVFIAYLINGSLVWLPAIQALAVLASACLAGLVGQRLSRHRRK